MRFNNKHGRLNDNLRRVGENLVHNRQLTALADELG